MAPKRSAELDDELKKFIAERLETHEHLEILLLLGRTPAQTWTPEDVAEELNIGRAVSAAALDHLCRHNLLDVRIGSDSLRFQYAPGQVELRASVERLAHAREDRLLEVLQLLSKNATNPRGKSALRSFADAFIVRGKKRDG